jgi:hypothetical protein
MTALRDRSEQAFRLVSVVVGECNVRPAKVTSYGYFYPRRRSRQFFV